MRSIVFFDTAQLMKAQAASLFLAPAGMPKPCELEPGKLPAGPAGIRAKRAVLATLLSACATSGVIQVMAWVRMLARPDICARIAWSSVNDITPGGDISVMRRA